MTALDLVVRARRIVGTAGVAPGAVGVRGGRIVALAPYDWTWNVLAGLLIVAGAVLLRTAARARG